MVQAARTYLKNKRKSTKQSIRITQGIRTVLTNILSKAAAAARGATERKSERDFRGISPSTR